MVCLFLVGDPCSMGVFLGMSCNEGESRSRWGIAQSDGDYKHTFESLHWRMEAVSGGTALLA